MNLLSQVNQLTREGRRIAAQLLEDERMTFKDAVNGGTTADDLSNPGGSVEKLPREAKEAGVRHLAHGASPTTLCGLDRAAVSTAHPSKARKTDCQACRDAYRAQRLGESKVVPEPRPEEFKTGDHVEFIDGSVWLVDDVRLSGADVHCLLGGGEYARGRRLTISAGSVVRVFLPGEFEALIEETKKAAEAAKLPAARVEGLADSPTPKVAKAPKWAPTVEEIAEVKRLRALGLSFAAIEATMNWPDGHGNRPFRIMKGAYDK